MVAALGDAQVACVLLGDTVALPLGAEGHIGGADLGGGWGG